MSPLGGTVTAIREIGPRATHILWVLMIKGDEIRFFFFHNALILM